MLTQEELLLGFHEKLLQMRSIENTISSIRFGCLYDEATLEDKAKARQFIDSTDIVSLRKWLHQQAEKIDRALMNMRQLRNLARSYRIHGYIYLSKGQLLSAIYHAEKEGSNAKDSSIGTDQDHVGRNGISSS